MELAAVDDHSEACFTDSTGFRTEVEMELEEDGGKRLVVDRTSRVIVD